MLPDRVSNPGPLTYESGALPIALRGPAFKWSNLGVSVGQVSSAQPIQLLRNGPNAKTEPKSPCPVMCKQMHTCMPGVQLHIVSCNFQRRTTFRDRKWLSLYINPLYIKKLLSLEASSFL